jgi:hypothetical protein
LRPFQSSKLGLRWPFGTGKVGQLVREASSEAMFPAAKVGVGIKVKIIKATDRNMIPLLD